MIEMNASAGPSQVRDDEYYFEDGNCVFWVEGCLFNLHRTVLRRNSAFFRNLFSLPQPADGKGANGQDNDQPIVCHDPAATFRAWCCALYSGFNDNTVEEFDEEKVAHIGFMAHKYECDAMESWVKDTLLVRLENQTGFANERLEYLLRVAIQCHWPRVLMTAVESHLLGSISEETPHHLRNVIRIADNVESEGLKGRAYHRFLCINKWSLSPPARMDIEFGGSTFTLADATSQIWSDPLEFLTDRQKLRLHHGFIGLSALRDRLRFMPSVETDCSCLAPLRRRWIKEAEKMQYNDDFFDPKEFLEEMRRKIGMHTLNHDGACGVVLLRDQINGFLDNFDDHLVKFFPKHL